MTTPGETAHQTYPATPEEVSTLSGRAEALARSQGMPGEFSPHVLSFTANQIEQGLVPVDARSFLELAGAPVDCVVSTDTRSGKTGIQLRQLAVPEEYPGCIFNNGVVYDLAGEGRRTTEATITNTGTLQTVVNPDHPQRQRPDTLSRPTGSTTAVSDAYSFGRTASVAIV